MQRQHKPYNKQVPMSDKNQLKANQPTAYRYNYQNAIFNNPQTYVGQNFENSYIPTACEPLSEDDELDVYTTEHSNNNTWQAVKKRKRGSTSNKTSHAKDFWLDTSNQYQELQVEEKTGTEENPQNYTASCALSKGSHPANYKGCTVYKDVLNAKNKHTPKRVTAQTTHHITNPHMN
jgi:hypothetical protein